MEDRRGYDELYRAERDPLIRQATKLLGNAADAEAFVHDAFAEALESWDTVRHYARPGAWVRHVMIRKIIDEQRRERTRRSAEPGLVIDLRPGAFESVEDLYTIELLSSLDQPNAQAVYLTGVLGFSSQEAAHLLDASPNAIRLRAMRGRQALQKQLGLAAKVLGVVPVSTGLGAQAQTVLAHLSGAIGNSPAAAAAGTAASAAAAATGQGSPAAPSATATSPADQSGPTNNRDRKRNAGAAVPGAAAALLATGGVAAAGSPPPAGAAAVTGSPGAPPPVGAAGAPSGLASAGAGTSEPSDPSSESTNRRKNVALAAFLAAAVALVAVVAAAADASPRQSERAEARTPRSAPRSQGRGPSSPSGDREPEGPSGPAVTAPSGPNPPSGPSLSSQRPATSTTTTSSSVSKTGGTSGAGATVAATNSPAAVLSATPTSVATTQALATTTAPPAIPNVRQLIVTVSSANGPLAGLPVIVRCGACDDTRIATTTDPAGTAQVTLAGAVGGWPTAATVSVYPNPQSGAGPFGTMAVQLGAQLSTSLGVSPGSPANAPIRWYSALPIPTYVTDSIDTVVHGVVEAPIGSSSHVQRTETPCGSAPAFGMASGSTDLVRCLGTPAQGVSFRSAGTTLWVGTAWSIRVPASPVLIAVEAAQGPLRTRSASGLITYADGTTSTIDGTVSEP